MRYSDLSPESGERYAEYVTTREPLRLIELAHDVEDTGGPIELLDGTPESLAPLALWYIEQANNGFAYLPGTTRGGRTISLQLDPAYDSRWVYAGETLAHYIAQVVRGYATGVRWAPRPDSRRAPRGDANQPLVFTDTLAPLPAEDIGTTFALKANQLIDGSSNPRPLRDRVEGWLGTDFRQAPRSSPYRLSDLLSQPRPSASDPANRPPVLEPDHRDRHAGWDIQIDHAIALSPRNGGSIDPEALWPELAAECRTPEGGAIQIEDFSASARFVYRDDIASVETWMPEGRIEGLVIQPNLMTAAEGVEFGLWTDRLSQVLDLTLTYDI